MTWALQQIAEQIGAELRGDGGCQITAVAPLDSARQGDISFLNSPGYRQHLATTRASAVILPPEAAADFAGNALIMPDPYLGFARLTTLLYPFRFAGRGIHDSAVVSPDAEIHPSAWIGENSVVQAGVQIGPDVFIGPSCVVGTDCRVGEASRLIARVTLLAGTVVGRRAILHAGCVIGDDGFGFARDGARWVKIQQLGRVVLGDDVEIGSNTTVDRGALGDTLLGDGVKLDNLIQIGHNVQIGEHTAMAALTGISGSTRIGARCMLAGSVGVNGHIEIADDVFLTGMSMVTKSIKQPGVYSSGMPAEANADWRKNAVRYRQLDDMARRLKSLEKQLESLNKGE